VDKYKVTMTDFVPSVFGVLVDYLTIVNPAARRKLETLRQFLIGGEELQSGGKPDLQVDAASRGPDQYVGPTETSDRDHFFRDRQGEVFVHPDRAADRQT